MIQLARGGQFIKEIPKRILFLFMVGVFIFCLTFAFYANDYFVLMKWLYGSYASLMIWFHPLFYLYVKSLVCEKVRKSDYILHSLPAIISFLFISVMELLMTQQESTYFYTHQLQGIPADFHHVLMEMQSWFFLFTKKIHAVQAIFYFFAVHVLLKNQSKLLQDLFSYGQKYSLRWLFSFNFSYAIVSLIGIVATLLPSNVADKHSIFLLLNMVIFAFFTMFIGFKGSDQRSPISEVIENDNEYNINSQPSESHDVLLDKIERYLQHEKAYLNPELTIWDIVRNTNINRTYISQTINQTHKLNFSQYINSLRIAEACRLIEDKGKYEKLEAIAIESGFNSMPTFNRSFKTFKGTTPSEYRLHCINLNKYSV